MAFDYGTTASRRSLRGSTFSSNPRPRSAIKVWGGYGGGGDREGLFSPESRLGGQGDPTSRQAPAPAPVSPANRLAKIIYEKNLAAEKEMKARDTEQAALNKQAYEAGMMSDEEYQGLESKGFEITRAQFGHVGKEFGERAYGRMNVGALRAGARDIKMREAEAIGGGVRELGLERLRRKSEASRIYSQAEQTRQSQYQIPRYDIPETMGTAGRISAISGQPGGIDYSTRPGTTSRWDEATQRWQMPTGSSGGKWIY